MKKVLIPLLLLCSAGLFAQQMGVGADIFIDSETQKNEAAATTTTQDSIIEIGGSFHYFADEKKEFMGQLVLGFDHNSFDNGTVTTSSTTTYIGVEGGLFLHMFQKQYVDFGLGGLIKITGALPTKEEPVGTNYDTYFVGSVGLAIPVFMDVKLNEKFILRLSADTAGLELGYSITEVENSNDKDTDTTFDLYSEATRGSVTFSFIYLLN